MTVACAHPWHIVEIVQALAFVLGGPGLVYALFWLRSKRRKGA